MCGVAAKVLWTHKGNHPHLRQWEWNWAPPTACGGRNTYSWPRSSRGYIVAPWGVVMRTSESRITMEVDSSITIWESKSFIWLFLWIFCCFGLQKEIAYLILFCLGKYQNEGGEPSMKLYVKQFLFPPFQTFPEPPSPFSLAPPWWPGVSQHTPDLCLLWWNY